MREVVDRNKDQSWKCEEEYHSSGRNLFFRFLIHLYFSYGIWDIFGWLKKKKKDEPPLQGSNLEMACANKISSYVCLLSSFKSQIQRPWLVWVDAIANGI